jgi:hypothetical protein
VQSVDNSGAGDVIEFLPMTPADQPAVHPQAVPDRSERRRLVIEAPEELVPEVVP